MDIKHFGDAQDIVKRSFLQWLTPCGKWFADPMFTSEVQASDAEAFSNFLGIELVTMANFAKATARGDRPAYFKLAKSCVHHLFLDPTTGVKTPRSRDHLEMEELRDIAKERSELLTMVYDQSISWSGSDPETQLKKKLDWLRKQELYAFAYRSHSVNFLIVSDDWDTLSCARDELMRSSRLPPLRFVEQSHPCCLFVST